jgi:hypothetical protein
MGRLHKPVGKRPLYFRELVFDLAGMLLALSFPPCFGSANFAAKRSIAEVSITCRGPKPSFITAAQ